MSGGNGPVTPQGVYPGGEETTIMCHKCLKPMRGPVVNERFFVFVCLECKSAVTYVKHLQIDSEYWASARPGSGVQLSPKLWKSLADEAKKLPLVKSVRIHVETFGP
jgi:hypothetical protein